MKIDRIITSETIPPSEEQGEEHALILFDAGGGIVHKEFLFQNEVENLEHDCNVLRRFRKDIRRKNQNRVLRRTMQRQAALKSGNYSSHHISAEFSFV